MAEREPNPQCLNIGLFNAYEMEKAEGGVKENICNTALLLRSRGHIVSIIAPRSPDIELSDSGINYMGVASNHKTNGTVTPTDRKPRKFPQNTAFTSGTKS